MSGELVWVYVVSWETWVAAQEVLSLSSVRHRYESSAVVEVVLRRDCVYL